jgi:hypothetical protein
MKAESRYPSDIGLNIFIGNFVNCMNVDHLGKLGITQVIGLTPSKDEKLGLMNEYFEYTHFPYNEVEKPQLNFEEIIASMQNFKEKEETK